MLPAIAAIVSTLVANNLPKLAQAVIDKGVDFVEEKTGVTLKPDPTPEELQKLRESEIEFEKFKITEENKNVADARAMQVAALNQEDKFSKRFVYYFATFWSVISSAYFFCITFMPIPEANMRIADMTSGFLLGTVLAGMFTYFFGSSLSSSRKDKFAELLQKEQYATK